MDARTLTALKASIKHWEENVAAETFDAVGVSEADCALCDVFRIVPFEDFCEGCPVQKRTGMSGCRRTPYVDAFDAFERWGIARNDAAKLAWRTAAQAELDFLKSLLPVEEAAE